jgi:collagenase-like PrtC family protease
LGELVTKLCVPTTFEDHFLDEVDKLNRKYKDLNARVHEIYGSFKTPLGTGRASTILPKVDEERFAKHVEQAHSYGMEFAFTLNPVCMNLVEYTEWGHKSLDDLLARLSSMKVDTLIIAIPYLIEYVAKNYPEFKINASSICYIDSLERALMYERLGADRLTLNEDVNRSFKLLKLIRREIRADLEVIANNGGLLKCPMKTYHDTINAHVSQYVVEDKVGFSYLPYPFMRCTLERLTNHKEIIRAPWFRPEDVRYYTEIGIDYIKIAGRGLPAKILLRLIEAYLSGKYEGDIYALIDNSYLHFSKDMFDPSARSLPPLKISIDNRSLDGWYEFFVKNDPPCLIACVGCDYCDRLAKRVVKTDPELEKMYIERIKDMIDRLASRKPPIRLKEKEDGSLVLEREDLPVCVDEYQICSAG